MNSRNLCSFILIASAGMIAVVGSIAIADSSKDATPTTQPQMKLPPSFTEADMQACMLAGKPGKMHEHLAQGVGVWSGKSTMWMAPGADPMPSECTSTVTSIMDGHYIRVEMAGDMPGMGPFKGLGTYGFDNVSQKLVSTWIDNQGTGIMTGTGELSADGKTITWKYTFNCPITRKPAILREIDTTTGADTKTLEMFGADPKTGKEFKMMSIELTRK